MCIRDRSYDFPIITGSENEEAIDINKLRAETGLITYDPGYKNTGHCISNITYLDGENGILRYRGYSVDELCVKKILPRRSVSSYFWRFTND